MSTFHIRRLPHYSSLTQPIFLTWRLHGSLPTNRAFPPDTNSGKAFVTMDHLLDTARTGPFWLKHPEIATMVQQALHHRNNPAGDFHLHAYVIMPNHIHVLITPQVGVSELMHSLKLFTARQANQILNRTGQPFWQSEYYDRLVRNPTEFNRITTYIEMNPVKAGLSPSPHLYPWSSATA